MKKTRYIISLLLPVLAGAVLSQSCAKEEEMIDPVDLRYDAENEYHLPASNPDPISFVVRSLDDPWKVYSYHPDWCDIEPSYGEKEDKYTVTVQYEDNYELDDRVDTLIIQSDYWIGLWVTVYQKGIAFLDTDRSVIPMSKDAGSGSFYIASNQKWSVEVTEGKDWLTLTGETSGESNGQAFFTAERNMGEMREGIVTVLDRHGEPAATVTVAQEGAQLDPETFELRVPYGETRVELPVTSNVAWTVAKDDAEVLWYDFEQTEFNGTATLVINMEINESDALKRTTFTLRTIAEEGSTPVEKQIVLKQAHDPKPERYNFSQGLGNGFSLVGWDPGSISFTGAGAEISGSKRLMSGTDKPAMGLYTMRFSNASANANAVFSLSFYGGNPTTQEIWWRMNYATGKTSLTATSYSIPQTDFPTDQANDISFRLSPDGTGFIKVEWLLNGEVVATLDSTSSLNAAFWGTTMRIYCGNQSDGSITLEWIEYTPVVDWNEGEE